MSTKKLKFDELPPHREVEHRIDLIPEAMLPNSPKEASILQKQVNKLLEEGLIIPSINICAVPALLVPKKSGEFRMCVDSKDINKIAINRVSHSCD